MSQYSHLSQPDPGFQDLMTKLPWLQADPGPFTPEGLRGGMKNFFIPQIMEYQRPLLPAAAAYSVANHTVGVDGGEITVRCIKPTPLSGELDEFPLLYWMHGGGWIGGDLDMDDFHLRILSVELRISIVNVDYRLAPEFKFPTSVNDSYTALKWTVENAHKFGGATSKGLIVAGASAGANLAAVLVHRARDDPFFAEHSITGQLLHVPAVVHFEDYPEEFKSELLSMEQNKDAPLLTKANIQAIAECLQVPPGHPDFSPLLYSHENLPWTYIQVAGLDPLRDEAILYERLLREAGAQTRIDIYPGVPHSFASSFPQLKASIKCEADLRAGLRWLLRQ
ncbi:alpha/beta hydrolase fold-domain-containing protein [Mycena rebaudengoi]|nr:alpha/beta hydrolase fold-domain-containing protein [Mycena rebaudengoi]